LTCLKCDSSCTTCYDSPTNCETCATGYSRLGWGCINSNHVKVSYKLTGDFSSFTTSNYRDVEKAVADIVGKDVDEIYLYELKEGSIVIGQTVNFNNIV